MPLNTMNTAGVVGLLLALQSSGAGAPIPGAAGAAPPVVVRSMADSARAVVIRDSLLSRKAWFKSQYLRFPTSIDSTFSPTQVGASSIHRSDASGISEILRLSPATVAVPFSLSSSINRTLTMGFVAPVRGDLFSAGDPWIDFHGVDGSDDVCATDMASIESAPSGAGAGVRHPQPVVSPEMMILWENGVFRENTLNVRFARPISRQMSVGVFSNYRHFAGQSYSHNAGSIDQFYSQIYDRLVHSSSAASRTGRSPLVDEQVSGLRLAWQGTAGRTAHFAYRYTDAENDLATQDRAQRASQGWGSLVWERLAQWGSDLDVGAVGLGKGPFVISGGVLLHTGGQKTEPFYGTLQQFRGWEKSLRLSIRPALALSRVDTAYVAYAFERARLRNYTGQTPVTLDNDIRAGYTHDFAGSSIHVRVGAEGGHVFHSLDSLRGNIWVGEAAVRFDAWGQSAGVFAASRATPFVYPYDTLEFVQGQLLDQYVLAGADAFLHVRKAGLFLAYYNLSDVNDASVGAAWPHGIAPYRNPRWSFVVSPAVGRVGGFLLSTRWMFSDAQPFLKAQAALSYEAGFREGRGHFRTDLVLDYWGPRDDLKFGDKALWPVWRREIYDVSLHSSIQIRTFRMYYKVDNLLNRRIAYVPGHELPGLTLRWGFNWMIQG